MKIYPICGEDGKRLPAFEIENAYIGPRMVARLLGDVKGVTNVVERKLFGASPDVHIEFNYKGRPYIVWEPYGDNSRYWIGPKDEVMEDTNIENLTTVFEGYRPPVWRTAFGDLVTLKIFTRLLFRK